MRVKFTTFAHMTRARYLMDGMHPLMQLVMLLSLVLVFGVIFTMLGMFLVKPFFGITTIDLVMQSAITNPEAVAQNPNHTNALKFIQFMSTLGIFLLPAVVFAWMKFPGGDFLRLNKHIYLVLLLMAVVIVVLCGPFINLVYELNQRLDLPASMDAVEKVIRDAEESTKKLTVLFLTMPTAMDLVINLVLIAFLPAIAEELMFRGCIQQVLKEWLKNAHIAIWIAAFLFSFIHFQFYGFVPRLLLGVLLGYLFYWSGSLWVPIVTHAVNNGAQVVLAYLYDRHLIPFDIRSEEPVPLSWVLISSVALVAMLLLFKRTSDQRKFIY